MAAEVAKVRSWVNPSAAVLALSYCCAALSEATTSPPFLQALGLPSPPSDAMMNFSCDSADVCRIDVRWSPSLDSGVGANSSTPLPLNYSLQIFEIQEASATQPIAKSCPSFDTLTAAADFASDDMAATSMVVSGLTKGSIYCIYIRARNNRLQLYSSPAVLMARPISPPRAPTQLALLLNPDNLANLTAGTVPGSVTWLPPADAGAGPGIPLRIVAYDLELHPCPEGGAAVNEMTATASFGYVFSYRCSYVVRVAARNEQDAALGAFSEWGPAQNLTVYVSQVAQAPPPQPPGHVRRGPRPARHERPNATHALAYACAAA
jgi:hypothetical protein